ncbi:MAG: AAA family ATPase [Lachnospira sp.]
MEFNKILDNVSRVIVGKEDVAVKILTSILAGGHVLLDDVPGTGKTMMAKSMAKSIDGTFSRIQFTPDLLPSDVTGIHVFNQKEGEFIFKQGPVFANIILADEINRATPRTQSALLECMEEHQVTVDGETFNLEEPFIVIATENPVETAGTYQLPEAQLDRFLMKISMGYPSKEDEVEILSRFLENNPIEEISAVCSKDDIIDMKREVKKVYIHPSLMEYIVNLVDATRNIDSVSIGVSPRGTINMVNAARAYAFVNGRDYVVPEDIKELAVSVWAHRLVLRMGMAGKDNREQIITNVLESCAVPTEEWKK